MTQPDPLDPNKKSNEELKSEVPPKKDPFANVYKYTSSNTRDTIAYVLLIIGIVLMFSEPMYGGFIVGLIFGFYFADELLKAIKSFNSVIEDFGMVRSLVIGGTLLALFISAPFLFIGAAVAVGLRQIIYAEEHHR